MELINFQGLNCYYNCIVSIASHLGVQYHDAFSSLWSETEFYYQANRKAYLTKRLPQKLESLGVRLDMYLCGSPDEARGRLAELREGEHAIIGMDAFFIPWNQIYKSFHGPHFFIARNTGDTFYCLDPTYAEAGESFGREEIIEHAFDITRMPQVAKNPPRGNVRDEAREILSAHPQTRARLHAMLEECAGAGGERSMLLSKYADALINNRYMFRHYLEKHSFEYGEAYLLFDDELFRKWKAVKNGLIKAGIGKNRDVVLAGVGKCLDEALSRETEIAEAIMGQYQ